MMAPWIRTFAEARWKVIVASCSVPSKSNRNEPPDGLVLRCFSGIDEINSEITGDFLVGGLYWNGCWEDWTLDNEKPVPGLIGSRMFNHQMNVSVVGRGGHWIVEEIQWDGVYTRYIYSINETDGTVRTSAISATDPAPVSPNFFAANFPSKWSGR